MNTEHDKIRHYHILVMHLCIYHFGCKTSDLNELVNSLRDTPNHMTRRYRLDSLIMTSWIFDGTLVINLTIHE